MPGKLTSLARHQPTWQLWISFALGAIFCVELIVAFMSWWLVGTVTRDYLITGLVAAAIVAPASLALLSALLREASIRWEEKLRADAKGAEEGLKMMVEVAKMMFWEYDVIADQLLYEDLKIAGLGVSTTAAQHSLAGWLNRVHPEDQQNFMTQYADCVKPDGVDLDIEYRFAAKDQGHWVWLQTRGRVVRRDASGVAVWAVGGSINVSERRLATDNLKRSETLLRLMCDNVPDMIWAKGLDKRYLFANKAVCDQLLMADDTNEPVGRDDLFFAERQRTRHVDVANWHTFGELCQDSDAATLKKGRPLQFDEFGNVRGEFMFLDVHKAPFVNEKGEVIGVVGSARNVTQQRLADEKLRLASLVLENSNEAMMITDETDRIVDVNPAFTKLTGYTLQEVIGENPALLHSGRQSPDFYRGMWREIEATGRWQGEIWNQRKSGEVFAEWLTINTFFHDDGSVRRRVALFSDITERKKSEELIWSQANFDVLTQLPNRRMFRDRLAQDLRKATRASQKLALLFLDLDRFKEVNDTLGHQKGDILLVEAARRIATCVRASDTVARLGGDEFTIILTELDDPVAAERIAENIIQVLRQPFQLGPDVVHVSASLGITLFPDDSTDLDELIKHADRAMYVAKSDGRNRFSYFTRAMQEAAQHRIALLQDLRGAMPGQQFLLHYQPIVALDTGRINKVEALLRWVHPVRGTISPAHFIPLAEESGLIHEIGDWVFMEAALQAKVWRSAFGADFQVSVNVSPSQMQVAKPSTRWLDEVQALGLEGHNLVIEITEGLLLESSAHVTARLLAFRDAGIQVAIDDFGTGYSALSYLKKLDIDYIKIDQSFIRNLATDASDMALSEAMVVMAHKLGLKVIAEGVETAQQRDLLAGMGCDFAQGYLYSKPVSASGMDTLLRTARA